MPDNRPIYARLTPEAKAKVRESARAERRTPGDEIGLIVERHFGLAPAPSSPSGASNEKPAARQPVRP